MTFYAGPRVLQCPRTRLSPVRPPFIAVRRGVRRMVVGQLEFRVARGIRSRKLGRPQGAGKWLLTHRPHASLRLLRGAHAGRHVHQT